MNGPPIHALERQPRNRCVWMKAKSTFLAWNALPSPTWATGSPNDDGRGLPMAAHGGNISPERRIVRWMLLGLVVSLGPGGNAGGKDTQGEKTGRFQHRQGGSRKLPRLPPFCWHAPTRGECAFLGVSTMQRELR